MSETLGNIEWHHIVQALGLLVSFVLAHGGLVTLIDRIKTKFNLSGVKVNLLVVVLATVWSVINMVVQGLITPEALNAANFAATLLLVLQQTQTEYLRLRKSQTQNEVVE